MKKLSQEVIEYRAVHGLTQKQFAALVGVSVPTIIYIENENRGTSKVTEAKIRMFINGEMPIKGGKENE